MGGAIRARWFARVKVWIVATGFVAVMVGVDGAGALESTKSSSGGGMPQGVVDAIGSPDAGRIAVTGWAFDRDGPGTPVSIHVYVGGPAGSVDAEGHVLGLADQRRPDVSSFFPGIGEDHGFSGVLTTARTGAQPVYVYALNIPGTPGTNTLIGARSVFVEDPSPVGRVDTAASPEPARVRVRGWTFDRNAVSTPTRVQVSVGGPAGSPGAEAHDVGMADRPRPDVAEVFPLAGPNHGFDVTFTTDKTGAQRIYVYGINEAGSPGSNTLLGSPIVTVKAPDDLFTPVVPTRIADSRPLGPSVGPYTTPWGTGTTRDVVVTGVGGVPANATAIALNVTVTDATAPSHLTLWPAGESRPTASNLNWGHDWTVANAVTVKVGAAGRVSVHNAQGAVHVVVDVVGYYRPAKGSWFTPLTPLRVIDSRPNGPNLGPYRTPWGGRTTREVRLAGLAGIPSDAVAVVLNATVTNTTGQSFLTMWPVGRPRPLASTVNWAPGWTIANGATVELGAGGVINVFNDAGSADVVLDVVGYFSPGSGRAFHPISPTRVQDSRPGGPVVGPYTTPWSGGVVRDMDVTVGHVPSYASAVTMNVTATGTSAGSHLTLFPTGSVRPLASSLNWRPGWTIANAVVMPAGEGGRVSAYNNAGLVDVVADVGGWYG
jgi:hypothetical protein